MREAEQSPPGSAIKLVYIITDNGSGDPDWFATDYTGAAFVVCNSKPDGSGTEYPEVYLRHIDGVHFTGQGVYIAKMRDAYYGDNVWQIVSPGAKRFRATSVGAISPSTGTASIAFYSEIEAGSTLCEVPVVLEDTNFTAIDNTRLYVDYEQVSGIWYVTWVGCQGGAA